VNFSRKEGGSRRWGETTIRLGRRRAAQNRKVVLRGRTGNRGDGDRLGCVVVCGVSKVEEVPCARNEIVQLELVPAAADIKRASELSVTWSDGCLQHPL
jgi:hypothetical protein